MASEKNLDHVQLVFGPYAPPRIPRNRRLLCEMRGYLRVGSWSDGTHSLAATLSDRLDHSLWRLRSGCRKRIGGSHFPPLERLPERGSEVATCTPCARIKPRNTAFKAPGQVGLRFTGPPACGHPGGEPQGDLWSRKNAARAFTHCYAPPHLNKCITGWRELGGTSIPTCGSGLARRTNS